MQKYGWHDREEKSSTSAHESSTSGSNFDDSGYDHFMVKHGHWMDLSKRRNAADGVEKGAE
jgi:hypothetical protein